MPYSFCLQRGCSNAITSKLVKRETVKDQQLQQIVNFISNGWPSHVDEGLKAYKVRKDELSILHGCILWGRRVVIPKTLQSRVLNELHEAHLGIVRTKALARSYVWWPRIDADIEIFCNNCEACRQTRNAPPTAAIHP